MLLLKKHLVELVRAGKKRQTIRYWTRPIVFAGQISFTPGLGKMKILRVDELAGYESLTLNDARDDGFDTLEELLAELKRNYPEVPPGKRLYRVVFQWPMELPKAAPSPTASHIPHNGASTNPPAPLVKTSRRPKARAAPSTDRPASPPATALSSDGCMSPPQRELLRGWVIAQLPANRSS
ncbi:MAG: ASCH domain-containing protein [Phycisphaerae bacterium]